MILYYTVPPQGCEARELGDVAISIAIITNIYIYIYICRERDI